MVAAFAAVSLVAVPVELTLPDVHDGDASSVVNGPDGLAGPNTPASSSPAQGHTIHVDHCAHGHLLVTADQLGSNQDARVAASPISDVPSLPNNPVEPPRSRPPIA